MRTSTHFQSGVIERNRISISHVQPGEFAHLHDDEPQVNTKRDPKLKRCAWRLRDLKANLDQIEEHKREDHQRHYVLPVRVVTQGKLRALDANAGRSLTQV